ncbi:MAG: hypothetical protein HY731_04540 [Candidatus Tectomicrobia bacterium]|nr:hypothetical protein [Candidatus Tectomicrobia bacterium]
MKFEWNNVGQREQLSLERLFLETDLLEVSFRNIQGMAIDRHEISVLDIRHIATGGAKRVYKVLLTNHETTCGVIALKMMLDVKLDHSSYGVSFDEINDRSIAKMNQAALQLNRRKPGLYPIFGGYWEWFTEAGKKLRIQTEEFIEGKTLGTLRRELEDQFVQRVLSFQEYDQEKMRLERQAVAAYLHFWDALDRQTFINDTAPWNVIFTKQEEVYHPTIVDLHGLTDTDSLSYVFQQLLHAYGFQEEIVKEVICGAFIDIFGQNEALSLLTELKSALQRKADEEWKKAGVRLYRSPLKALEDFLLSQRL